MELLKYSVGVKHDPVLDIFKVTIKFKSPYSGKDLENTFSVWRRKPVDLVMLTEEIPVNSVRFDSYSIPYTYVFCIAIISAEEDNDLVVAVSKIESTVLVKPYSPEIDNVPNSATNTQLGS